MCVFCFLVRAPHRAGMHKSAVLPRLYRRRRRRTMLCHASLFRTGVSRRRWRCWDGVVSQTRASLLSLSLSLSSCMDQDPRAYHASRGYLGALGRPLFLDHQPLFPFSRYSPVPNLLLDLNTRLSSYSHVPDLHSEFFFLVAYHTA